MLCSYEYSGIVYRQVEVETCKLLERRLKLLCKAYCSKVLTLQTWLPRDLVPNAVIMFMDGHFTLASLFRIRSSSAGIRCLPNSTALFI